LHHMIKEKTSVQAPGLFFIRVLLGIIFFMQGYGKVFTIGLQKVYDMFFKVFETSFLPQRLIVYTAYYTSYAEMICGFLLIIGLFRRLAMYLLAIDLLVVSFGHGLMEPIWDLSHVMPRAILLSALFLLPSKWDKWSIDALIKKIIALSV
jgi:uncharacterized membrane protein YphA (DoxX/SURF4 family)